MMIATSALEVWKELDDLASSQIYPAAAELFQQDSPVQEIYVIARGLVKLIRLEPNGRELMISLRSPGWLLGAASAIMQKPHLVGAVTLTQCHLRRIPASLFLNRVQNDVRFSWRIQQLHSCEVLDQVTRLTQLQGLSARYRLEDVLWHLITAPELSGAKKEIRLQLPLKNQELAALISITPEHFSRLLKQLCREGVIRLEKGRIIIHDSQKLWHTTDLSDLPKLA